MRRVSVSTTPQLAACNPQYPHRRGLVLIVVLVVIMLLSLGAYTFSEYMVIENRASALHARMVQARSLADSGVEYVAVILGDRANRHSVGLYHNPGMFQSVPVVEAEQAAARGRFSIMAAVEGDPSARNVRFGLIDESAKLNLNTIAGLVPAEDPSADSSGTSSGTSGTNGTSGNSGTSAAASATTNGTPTGLANPLMGIPGMTQEISEAILDWIDDDDDSRTYGAESDYYQSESPPYECKNGKLETLDELLLVRGVTPQLLFGEDANRNGLLDPNENDGAQTDPPDNADGILQRGWADYLTVYSRELNVQADRSPRINLSTNTLSDIYDQIEDQMGEEYAKFVIAYRLYGPVQTPTNGQTGGTSSGSANSNNSSGPVDPRQNIQQNAGQAAQQLGQAVAGRSGTVTRAGMDLTNGGKFPINSLYDLIGVKVQGQVDGSTQMLESPWRDDPQAMSQYLPDLEDTLGSSAEQFIDGRININQCHREVLLGLPNMTEELATAIVNAQLRGPGGEPITDTSGSRATTAFLYQQGVCDLATLRALSPYITARGDVYRVQILGHFDAPGPVVRIEAVIDATQNPPQAVFFRDLTDLGTGFPVPFSQ